MSIIDSDDREIITSFEFPYSTVNAVDLLKVNQVGSGAYEISASIGSGITVAPNHVLTAAHNAFNRDPSSPVRESIDLGIRTTTSENENDLETRELDLESRPGQPDPDTNVTNVNYLAGYRERSRPENDLALFTTNDAPLEAKNVVGIMAFVDPTTAQNFTIKTAGYPGDNVDESIPGNTGEIGRDLIRAPEGENSTGTIVNVLPNGRIYYSENIDTAYGQSGSGIWHTSDEDDLPRVLGVHNSSADDNNDFNYGRLITKDIYDKIIDQIETDSGIENADQLPENAIIGSENGDEIIGTYRRERIIGNSGNDTIEGGIGNADDRLEGGEDNDILNGGAGDDISIFSDNFENYEYSISEDEEIITISHIDGTQKDGTDTLKNIEWGIFAGEQVDLGTLVASSSSVGAEIARRRIIPLPLTDGIETTEYVEVASTVANPNPNDPPTPPTISLTAPVAMLDGDVDYTLNILPYQPDTEYNVVYVIDTSISIDAVELQTIQDAYTELTNFYINEGIAENIDFGVVSFDSSGRFHTGSSGGRNLTADEAITALQDLTIDTGIGTRYFDGLNQADQFLLNSRYNPFTTTSIGYFFTDGQNSGDRFDMLLKARDVRELANFQAIAYYSDLDTLSSNSLKIRDVNWIDSNQGVFLDNISELSSELLKSDLADDVESVNILLDDELVETITPDQLTDSPLGLTYEGSVDGLDVSIDAENVITAEVVFTDEAYLATTTVDYTVTAGESEAVDGEGNDIAQSSDGNGDPFERTVDGGDSDDEITLGYADRGANGGAGSDEIIGNRRDNTIDGGAGDDTISAYEGNDTITTGSGRDKVNGGSGIDTAVYDDVAYQSNNISLRQAGNSVSYNNTDTLTDVEFIQFSDVRISSDTLEITPVVEVAELSITEGNSDLTTARLDFNLSTPAPVDVVFDYSSEDIAATAESDYTATSGQVTIPAGETRSSINIEIIADKESEESEQFALNFSNLSGATFSNNLTNDAIGVTIFDDDIALPDNAIAEYGTITNLNHSKQTIDLINTYTNPVVFVQPPSYNEDDPAIVRLDNITAGSFEAMIQEPEYNDGIHEGETASYFVFEAGTWQLEDGTLLEVGTNSSSGLIKQGFDSVEFEQDFETSPIIISTVQTNNGTQFVRTRQQNPSVDGFSIGMEESEANQYSGHATEELGWLAIEPGSGAWGDSTYLAGQTGDSVTHQWNNLDFNSLFDSTPQLMAGLSSYDGSDPSGIRYRNSGSNGVEIKVEEDQSFDSETDHTTEVVDFLAVEGTGILSAIPTPSETIIGEVGTISNLNPLNQTITLNNTYTNPVVFALPVSYNDEEPAIARINNIDSDSFSVYLSEPEYLDDQHADETITYLVIEAGTWELENGTRIEVGSLDTNKMTTSGWEDLNFESDFAQTPAVLSQVQTDNGTQFVRTRQ